MKASTSPFMGPRASSAKRGARARRVLLGVLSLAVCAAAPRAQEIDVDTWARLLVDHPLAGGGDKDRVLHSWMDLINEEPDHPLVEATLRFIGRTQADDVADADALAVAVAALDGSAFSPWAAQQLSRLQANLKARRAPVAELSADLRPDQLARFVALGPLPPLDDPLAYRSPPPAFSDPGFARGHEGIDGELRWQPLLRSKLRDCVLPDDVIEPAQGWVLVANCFDVPRGGPAWLELTLPRSDGADLFGDPGGFRGRSPPGYAFALNGEAPRNVELLGIETSPRTLIPVVLRTGRNRLMFDLSLEAWTRLAVRVLGPDARPWPGLVEVAADDAPLGTPVAAAPPTQLPPTSEAFLAALPARGAEAETLLGMLQILDGREAEGLAHVRAAVEAEPARVGLTAHLARLTLAVDYLPETWKKNRARELAERVLAAQPQHLGMGLFLAGLLSDEDKEEEAIERQLELTQTHQRQVASLFALQDTYAKLNMDAQAEAALQDAVARQPRSAGVLNRQAAFHERHGQASRAVETSLAALRAAGSVGASLQRLAGKFAALGELDRALELFRESLARDGSVGAKLAFARFLLDSERLAEADALYAEAEAAFPTSVTASIGRADVARRRGDPAEEQARLREVLARRPSNKSARERLFALTGDDPTEAYFARYRLDEAAVRAAWSDAGSKDSVVKVLDHGVVKVFADGGMETLSQDIWQARDLQGCEELGDINLGGDVLKVATVKADGTVFEPVRTGGSYVMPSLKPGDFVVTETRQFRNPPGNRVLRAGSWAFASNDHPFHISRYAISVPKSLAVRLEQRNFTGEHTTADAGDAIEHVFEARDQERVLVEPGAPPGNWYLPWIEFGMDADREAANHGLLARVLEPKEVTPEIREAAARATQGVTGQQAQARALHTFVNDTLDQRGWQPATQALLSREGSGTYLFAALLDAAGIDYELVWTRNVSPESDPEPDPPFVEAGELGRKLLVLVTPDDGPPAWCDLDLKLMPYGQLVGDAPRAPALAVPELREIALPDLPLSERPTVNLELQLDIAPDGSARVSGHVDLKAGLGFLVKEQIRDIPAAYRKLALDQVGAQVVPGLEISEFQLPGLDETDPPLGIHATGRVPAFLDDDGAALVCKLPMPAMSLAQQLAGGEGVRKLPYFLDEPQVQITLVRLHLEDGLSFAALPGNHVAEFHGGRYALTYERDGEHGLTIRREIALPPFVIPAGEYAEFAAFCAGVDEAERSQLRFTRSGAAAAGGPSEGVGPAPMVPVPVMPEPRGGGLR